METQVDFKAAARQHMRALIDLSNAQAELEETRQWAAERRALGFPEEMLQEHVVKAQAKFELARRVYLNLEV